MTNRICSTLFNKDVTKRIDSVLLVDTHIAEACALTDPVTWGPPQQCVTGKQESLSEAIGQRMDESAQQRGICRVVSTHLPTVYGVFELTAFERATLAEGEGETALVMTFGDLQVEVPLLRIHSQCLTGEVLGSLRCDCRGQLEVAMSAIAGQGGGLIIYLHQEGRGIGLMAKLKAYALQDQGLDTIEANEALGFDADCRDFSLAVAVLNDLSVRRVRLLSNNPQKVKALTNGGIEVTERIACEPPPNPHALPYLRTKKQKMGHALTVV
jgi:GTP cyclohydrolase II